MFQSLVSRSSDTLKVSMFLLALEYTERVNLWFMQNTALSDLLS